MSSPTSELVIVETLHGNESDDEWRERLAEATVDAVYLDQWEAQKSRLRRKTANGAEIAVSLDRNVQLRDGDILSWNPDESTAIVARITLKEVMEVDLSAIVGDEPKSMIQTCLELGHALGNQHWPAVIKGTKVYVPLTVAQPVMNSVMRTHSLEGVTHRFIPGAEVIPYIAPHEARRLFGGAARDGEGHTHGPAE